MAAQCGAALLEVLVAVLLLMIGILVMIELQGNMLTAGTEAQLRSEATYLADELIGQMSVDQGNLAGYVTTSGSCSNPNCSAWVSKVASTLPSGSATVTVNGTLVQVQITWTEANAPQHSVQVSGVINY